MLVTFLVSKIWNVLDFLGNFCVRGQVTKTPWHYKIDEMSLNTT